jgi:acetyl esterase/lipase
LKRYRFVPPGDWPPNKTFPTVLMVPPNVFKNDMITDDGEMHERHASYDLQFAGFLVFQVETRLAPPGSLPDQQSGDSGYAPEQTDDLKRQILAAINDSQCDGEIFLVGGSAGGTLALWCALDAASTVTGWDETARAHIKAVVSLSGPSQFCDWTNPGNIPPDALTDFEHDLENYVHLPYSTEPPCDPNCDLEAVNCPLDEASPAWLVSHGATSNPPAFMLYATDGDPVPNAQAGDMFQALMDQYGTTFDVQLWIILISTPVHTTMHSSIGPRKTMPWVAMVSAFTKK